MYTTKFAPILVFLLALPGFQANPTQNLHKHDRIIQGGIRFVGLSSSKAFFAIMVSGDLEYVTNYCHTYRMLAASIDNESENNLVATYLSASPDIDSLWLPATDHITEGTFAWIRNKAPLDYANWNTGYPSINTTRNCVVIQKDGKWTEELCAAPTVVRHFGLCELPLLGFQTASKHPEVVLPQHKSTRVSRNFQTLDQSRSTRMLPIGGVGTKTYFKDETLEKRKLFASLDFCHEQGMRLVTPESPEEFQFLGDYSRQMAEEGQDSSIFTSGTDTLATDCGRSNSIYRWFYSGEQVQLDGDFISSWWYKCLVLTPENFFTPDCIGFASWTLCELNTES